MEKKGKATVGYSTRPIIVHIDEDRLDPMMIQKYHDHLIREYGGRVVLGPRGGDEVFNILSRELDLEPCAPERVDAVTQDSLCRTNEGNAVIGGTVVNLERLEYYIVQKNEKSLPYYKDFGARLYEPHVYLYWDREKNQLSSNCHLLSCYLSILRGVSPEEAEKKSPLYLAHLAMWEGYRETRERLGYPCSQV